MTTNAKDYSLWTEDFTLDELGIDVPAFAQACGVDSPYDVAGISEGGCASGACMPAVSYYEANKIMAEHGNDVLEYLEDSYGEIPQPPKGESWSGIAVFYLSAAIDSWASSIAEEVQDALNDKESES